MSALTLMTLRLGLAILLIAGATVAQQYTISTFAGGALPVNIPGTSAELYVPQSVAADQAGNVFFTNQNTVLRLDAVTGILTLAAGSGTQGFSVDGGPATSAQLYGPAGLAVDSVGNLYIADSSNNRIRKVSNGVITTVAGGGFSLGDNGPATGALLTTPRGVAIDSSGNLYIADLFSYRIRKISNGLITTVAGSGTQGFSGDNGPATSAQLAYPSGVAVDLAGDLYIADYLNSGIREISNGVINRVAGISVSSGFRGDHGQATNAQLNGPSDVAVDSTGNLYIADTFNSRIRKVSLGIITTVAGGGTPAGDHGPAISIQSVRSRGRWGGPCWQPQCCPN